MTRDELAALERALRETEPPDAGPARERARRTVLAAHAQARATRARPAFRPARLGRARRHARGDRRHPARQRRGAGGRAARARHRPARREAGADTGRPTSRCRPRGGCSSPTPTGSTSSPAAGSARGSVATTTRPGHPTGSTSRRAAAGRWSRSTRPRRRTRWTLRPGARVSLPRWSPGGLHIAYRAGGALRIVWGNGEHDVLAGRDMAPVAPAWRPGAARTVAWAADDGTVTVEDADTAKVLWTHEGGPVHHLAWSGDGRRLLIAGRRHGAIHTRTPAAPPSSSSRPARNCSPRRTAATGSRSRSAAPRARRSAPAVASCPPPAAWTSSSGRRTAAGCWPQATSG